MKEKTSKAENWCCFIQYTLYLHMYKYTRPCNLSNKLRIGITRNGVLSKRLNQLVNTVTNLPTWWHTEHLQVSGSFVSIQRFCTDNVQHVGIIFSPECFKHGSCLKWNCSRLLRIRLRSKNCYSPGESARRRIAMGLSLS